MSMFKLHVIKDFQVGIGDLSDMVGVSTRQLRYWEKKGYIESIGNDNGVPRKFSLETCYRVAAIRSFLDEGYTLAKAVEKSEFLKTKISLIRKFEHETITDVKISDVEKLWGQIDYGYLDAEQTKKVVGVIDANGAHLEIREVGDR